MIEYPLKGGDIVMNKSEMFRMYLSEDLMKAEDNYKKWFQSYELYLNSEKASKELRTYYRRETEVAYALWQYKLRCYNKQFKISPISE
jgi:hypothetical protein